MASPEETLSPSFLSHLVIFPSFIVGESAGSWIAVAMVLGPLFPVQDLLHRSDDPLGRRLRSRFSRFAA